MPKGSLDDGDGPIVFVPLSKETGEFINREAKKRGMDPSDLMNEILEKAAEEFRRKGKKESSE